MEGMWPFCRHRSENKSGKLIKRLITGLIIGGAIGSVIGRHLMEKHEEELDKEEKGKD